MQKISVTLDVSKFDKSKIVERKFKTKDGTEKVVKEYKVDVVELKPDRVKVLKEGNGWVMKKTHFVSQAQTKEERDGGAETVYVGEGITFEQTGGQKLDAPADDMMNIPF